MDFVRASLKEIKAPDPLWLYKVGTSLIKQAADLQAKQNSSSPLTELHGLVDSIDECIKNPERIRHITTPFEPLIQAITDEARQFNAVFRAYNDEYRQYRQDGGKRSLKDFIHDAVALDVLKSYKNSGLFLHLAYAGDITNEQFALSMKFVIQGLNRYGANGFAPMWEEWQLGKFKDKLLPMLMADERSITPLKVHGLPNTTRRPYSRKDYLASEMELVAPTDSEKYQEALWNLIPQTLGPDYVAARDAKESLIAKHIKTGEVQFGDDFWVHIAALHPQYERANRMAATLKVTPGFCYQEPGLEITAEEIANIRAGHPPVTFNEALDARLGRQNPDRANALGSAHQIISGDTLTSPTGVQPTEDRIVVSLPPSDSTNDKGIAPRDAESPTEKIAPTEKPENTTPPNKADTTARDSDTSTTRPSLPKETTTSNNHKNLVLAGKVGSTLLGGLLIYDQSKRARRKDEDHERTEKGSKLVNYAIGAAAAAGVALVVLAKPETLVKFVADLSKFFGKSAGRA